MKSLFLVFAAALLMIGGLYYQFFYPPSVLKRETEKALQAFAASVEMQDRAKVSESLKILLADDAKIHLEVSFLAIIQTNANRPIIQDFDKVSFTQFLDNVLYPLTEYHYTPQLETFVLADDGKTVAITFTSKEWADGASLYGGVSVDMRYSSDTTCEGQVAFLDEKVQLKNASCKLSLRTVPKPGQASKLQNYTDAMREYLQR